MGVNRLFVFDCGEPAAPIPMASFTVNADGTGQLHYLSSYSKKTAMLDAHPPYLSYNKGEVRIPRHLDGTFSFSDSSPGGWGTRVITWLLERISEPVPGNAFEWLLQSKNFGSGRLAFSPDISYVPKTTPVTATLRDLTPEFINTLSDLVESSEAPVNFATLGMIRPGCDLGGVRPKTLIIHEGREHIVKFSLPNDSFDVPTAEYATLRLAYLAGVSTPSFELINIGNRTALLVERFDRTKTGERVHYLSAYSLLNPGAIRPNCNEYRERFSYGGIAEAIHMYGEPVPTHGHELFRRMVLNIMVGNVDDHLRNHAVLMKKPGVVELSPAFDICPHPEASFRSQSIGVGTFGTASTVENALSQCTRFHLTHFQASKIISETKDVVATWRQVFTEAGISKTDLRRLGPCFIVADQATRVTVNLPLDV